MPDLLDRLKQALADWYRVDREIGRGGMAQVFLETDGSRAESPGSAEQRRPEGRSLLRAPFRVSFLGRARSSERDCLH